MAPIMKRHIVFVICSCLTFSVLATEQDQGDFYTSVSGLEELTSSELFLIDNLKTYIAEKKEKLSIVDRYLEVSQEMHSKGIDDIENHLNNPINGYLLIKRLTKVWSEFVEYVTEADEETRYLNDVNELIDNAQNVHEDDVSGAANGLARLQSTYKLSTSDLANGIINGKKYSQTMSTDDCYQIGVELFKKDKFELAVEWFNKTLSTLPTDSFFKVDHSSFLEYYLKTLNETENFEMAADVFDQTVELNQKSADKSQIDQEYFETLVFEIQNNRKRKDFAQPFECKNVRPTLSELYQKTCSGELIRSATEQRDLRCRYVTNNIPFNKLGPFKYEEISLDPYLVIYHNAIYQTEIDAVIQTAEGNMVRSTVSSDSIVSDVRTSKQTWLFHDSHKFLKPILRRMDDMTGLNSKSTEAFQVANYGIGGHYGPHYDFFPPVDMNQTTGNRIATAMFYIGNVYEGGATAFPFLKIALQPVHGSLVFWFNLHKSLEPDYRTKHAGCPVLIGSKWIMNEWYKERMQEFYRPCGLHQEGYKSSEYEFM